MDNHTPHGNGEGKYIYWAGVSSYLFALLLFTGVADAAPDFEVLMENADSDSLFFQYTERIDYQIHRRIQFDAYSPDLTHAENDLLIDSMDRTGVFHARTPMPDGRFATDGERLSKILDNLPRISEVPGMNVDEVYFVCNTTNTEQVGDAIVAHLQPLAGMEEPSLAAFGLNGAMEYIPEDMVIYRVQAPYSAVPTGAYIEPPQYGRIMYNYGSSFRVTGVRRITLERGPFAGKSFREIFLSETDSVSEGETIWAFNVDNGAAPLDLERLSARRIPKDMQVRVSSCSGRAD